MLRKRILNSLFALFLILTVLTGTIQVAQGSGGPDDGGYIYKDVNDSGGPVYSWEEIATTGTQIKGLTDNGYASKPIDIPFNFHFYGKDYTQVYVDSNGYLVFPTSPTDSSTPAELPSTTAPRPIIAGYWANLNPSASGAVVAYQTTGSSPNRHFVVEYSAVPHSGLLNGSNKVTFEIKLIEGTNDIEVHYNSMTSDGNTNIVGIQNDAGSAGLTYFKSPDPITNSTAVRFSIFIGVALRPEYEIQYGQPGDTLTFEQRISNWTGSAATFTLNLTVDGKTWDNQVSIANDFQVNQMANGESRKFNVSITIPPDAVPADYSQIKLDVAGGGYTATSTIVAAVPRRGFALGYFDANSDTFSGIMPLDTKFHNSLKQPYDGTNLGPFLMNAVISPDGKKLWVVGAGESNMAYALDTSNLNNEIQSIPAGSDASGIAFTPDGKTVLIGSYGGGQVEVVDVDTLATITLTTGSQVQKIATSACFPRKAYVTNNGAKSVSVINVQTKQVTSTITGFNAPVGVVVSPRTNRAFVANNGGNAGKGIVSVIDTLTDTRIADWDVGGDTLYGIDITPDGNKLYVASGTNVKVVNADTGKVIATIATPLDKLTDVEVFPEGMGSYAYVTTGNKNYTSILVIDTSTDTLVKQIEDSWTPVSIALFPMETECSVKPVASFTPTSAVAHLNEPITWTNTSTFGATSYLWDFGDGSTSTEEHPTHTYTDIGTGSYTVTLTATNSHGSDVAQHTVNFAPRAAFNPLNSVIHLGDPISFTNQSTGTDNAANPMTYTWDFGDGETSSNRDVPHTYKAAGDYTVKLTAQNAFGTDTVSGKVDFVPSAAFTPTDTTIRPGDSVTFTNASVGTDSTANPLTYSWDFGDGSTSTEASPTHAYAGTGDVTVTLTAHNGFGADSTATGQVKFRPKAAFSPAHATAVLDQPVAFTDQSTGPGPFTYLWDFGDGATSTEQNPSHTYTTASNYTVKLTVTNSHGEDTAVGSVGFSPTADFTQSASVIHVNDTVTFTNTSTGVGTLTYQWDFGDGATSTEASPKHQYTTIGNYTVKLTATNDYGSTSKTSTVNFYAVAAFSPASSIIQTGDTVSFTNQSTGSATLTYVWDFGDKTGTSTEANPKHTYTAAGSYTVTLTAHNGFGADSTATGTVVFKPKAAFSPLNSVIHLGDEVTFTNQSTGTAPLTYAWDFGDNSTSTETSPKHTYAKAGAYTVKLTAHNAYSPDSTVTGTVLFAPTASFTQSATTIRPGESVTFTNTTVGTDSTANPLTYTWNFGDGSTSTEASPTHTFTGTANVTVTLTAHNGLGTDSTATGAVAFRPRAAFTPTKASAAVGQPVTFTDQSTGPGPFTYAWTFGDGGSSTSKNPSYTYTALGDYTVTLTVKNSNGEDSTTGKVGFIPAAAFSQSASVIHVNDTITFTNATTGTTPMTYSWDFGDGATSTEASPKHQYTTIGNYTVKLTATNDYGSTSKTSTVNFYAVAAFGPASSTIQTGDTVSFTNQSTGSATLTYVWDFGDKTGTSTEANPKHTYTAAGSYTVTLTAHNGFGADSTATGTVVFKPKAAFSPLNSVIHLGDEVTFTNQSTGTAPLTYTWDFGDNSTSTETSPKHTYAKAGAYTVKLTAHNAYSPDSTVTGTVLFAPTASFTQSASVIQTGDSISFTNTSVGTDSTANPLTYTWNFGDGSTSTQASPTHQYNTAGNYTITLTAHNGLGTDSTATGTVVFRPKAAFSPLNSVIHLGDEVTFTNQSTGTATVTYKWDFGDNSTSTETSPKHTYTKAGAYTVTLTAHNAYSPDSTVTGTVLFAPTAGFTQSASVIQTGDSISFTNTSVGTDSTANPLTYTWEFGDGSTSTQPSPTHQYTVAGSYTVRLTAHNGLGNDSVATGTVAFRPKAIYSQSSSVIQTGDTVIFTNQSTGTAPLTYTWDFGDKSAVSHDTSPKHQYTTAGTYTVTLTVHNAYSPDSTATSTVVFRPRAAFTPSASVIRVGEEVTFANQSTGTGTLTYIWNFGDGSDVSTETSPKHTYTQAGAYNVTLTAHNTYGPDDTTSRTILFAPTAGFNPVEPIIQAGDSILFTNTSVGTDTSANPLTYTWDFGDGSTSHDISPEHQYPFVGVYTVRLTAHNGLGTDSVATTQVYFKPKAGFSASARMFHVNDVVNFTNLTTGTTGLTYVWDFGDGETSTEANPEHIFKKSGHFMVKLTATNGYGSDVYILEVIANSYFEYMPVVNH